MNLTYIFIIFAAIFGTIGQFFLKLVAKNVDLAFTGQFLKSFLGLLKEPFAYLAVIAYVICTVFYLKAIKDINLGVAYSVFFGAMAVLTIAGSAIFFKESLSSLAFLGIALIIVGVILIFN